ncbi:MAG: hypothetical protein PF961_00025, partial [Planctomycetota bacterium]|nr:hypothetical protein [Planctomycetota bacterium]
MTWLFISLALMHVLAACIASIHLLTQDKRPAVLMSWILFIGAVPAVAVAAYAFFGTDRLLLRRLRRRQA